VGWDTSVVIREGMSVVGVPEPWLVPILIAEFAFCDNFVVQAKVFTFSFLFL
jgi:hypothetical protein